MKDNRQIETSSQVYVWLLGLYPEEYRSEYGTEMARLFADQYRSEVDQRGGLGLLALWLRTLIDLGKTVLIEHLSSPQAKTGLLQATPGMPLPWKGVVLVLIPGLIVFISQMGQLTGKDWFFTTLSWSGYAFLIPALLVWLRTLKFPVWGLVPLGLVFRNLADNWGWLYHLSLVFVLPLKRWLQPSDNPVVGDGFLGVPLIFLILIIILAWLVYRHKKFSRTVWMWLGVYLLIVMVQPGIGLLDALKGYHFSLKLLTLPPDFLTPFIFDLIASVSSAAFLLLILLGALLARRQGRVAILLLVGYLLPVILYGTYNTYPGGNTANISPVWIITGVFTYRLCIAILAPIWLARSASRRGQTLAAMIPIAIALFMHTGLEIAQVITWNYQTWMKYSLGDITRTFSAPLVTITGFILALVLYQTSTVKAKGNRSPDAIPQGYVRE